MNVRAHHKRWLKAVENSVYFSTSLSDLGVTPKRIDILLDMGLIEMSRDGVYELSEKGRVAIASN